MVDKLKTPEYSNLPLFGRKWKVSVLVPKTPNVYSDNVSDYKAFVLSDSTIEDKALRVTFTVQKFGNVAVNYTEMSVYNVMPELEIMLAACGTRVQIEAGYVNGNFGVIYDGAIFQPMWEREDHVTTKLTFKCIDTMDMIFANHVETKGTALDGQKNMLIQMMAASRKPFQVAHWSEGIVSNPLPRPKVFFDTPVWYLRKFAQQNGTLPTGIDRKIYMDRPQDTIPLGDATKNALELSPGQGGLIGWPQQTQDGIYLTCLLNPNITVFNPVPMLIKVKNRLIRQMEIPYNQEPIARLDEDNMYRVLAVEHVGDTRGQDWYTKITGATMYDTVQSTNYY